MTKKMLGTIAGFVFQEATFHSYITTEEALRTAAALKLPSKMSKEEKEQRVQVLLDAFDLRKCAKTKVGDSRVKGISGGEKKRLSIAIEVLTGPPLLFLDEPTTGLDAASSLMVVKLLRNLADLGTTVVMVLHQPRASILEFIDTYLILSDGRDVFYGNLENMIEFFEYVGMPIPLRTNPLDFVLDVINTNDALDSLLPVDQMDSFAAIMRGSVINTKRQQEKLIAHRVSENGSIGHGDRKRLAQELSDSYRHLGLFEKYYCADDSIVFSDNSIEQAAQQGSSFLGRLVALLRREFMQKLRNPEVYLTQLGGATVLGLVMGSIYYQMSPTQIFNKTAAISFAALLCVFMVFPVILLFPVERNIWLRDRDNGLYRSIEYYISIVLAGIPGEILSCCVLATILYWMFGLIPTVSNYFIFLGFMELTIFCASSMFLLGGAVSPSSSVAISLVAIILLFVMVFNGFFILLNSIPAWYRWIAEINFMRFSINALYWNEFHGQVYNCTVGIDCTFSSGDAALTALGIPVNLELWRMAVYMMIVTLVFHILALVAVTFCYTGSFSENLSKQRKKKIKKKIICRDDIFFLLKSQKVKVHS